MHSSVAFIDFETRSEVDIKTAGADVYARHPSTDVMCMAFCLGEGPIQLWSPQSERELPCLALFDLFNHIREGRKVVGHNIGGFDLQIWNHVMHKRYGWPELKIEQIVDTMAEAYAMALPGSLENAAAAVGLEQKKDMAGNRIMRQLSAPRAKGPCTECLGNQYRIDGDSVSLWNDMACKHCNGTAEETIWHTPESAPEKFSRLYEYCMQDLEVTRELYKRLMRLSPQEQKLWQLDWKINQRGIQIDLPAVKSAIEIVKIEKARLDLEMREVTGNMVAVCNAVGQLKDFLEHRNVTQVGLAKADVVELLADPSIPKNVRRALELRQEAAKTSTAKLVAMLNGVCEDGRLRGMFQYHGAGTGRWAGRRVQLQNLKRPEIKQKDIDAIFEILKCRGNTPHKAAAEIEILYGSPTAALSNCIRGFLTAPEGDEFVAADLSAIEARATAWLAGEAKVVQQFADFDAGLGKEPYCLGAEDIYGYPIEKATHPAERNVGKTARLQLGFGGGIGAFGTMAKTTGVDLELLYKTIWPSRKYGEVERASYAYAHYKKRAEDPLPAHQAMACDIVKQRWRAANPAIVNFWKALEEAAIAAVKSPEKKFVAHGGADVTFLKKGSFLWMQLPSKRAICYPYPEVKEKETPWGTIKSTLSYMGVDSLSNVWRREHTYAGKICENAVQGLSRDALAWGMLLLEDSGHPIVLHAHDEAVIQKRIGSVSVEEIENIVSTVPAWAAGLPMSAEGFHGKRYRK